MILSSIISSNAGDSATWQLLISLGGLTAIVWLFLRYCVGRTNSDTSASTQDQNSKDGYRWIHILYIGGIATFIILEFIVYIVLNNDEKDNIIATISFGSTLSSLIMSIVAIIFTIVHGRNGESQLGQITQATNELTTTASSLVGFKDIANDIDDHIATFQSQIERNIGNLSQSINDRISQINDILNDVRDKTTEVREHQKLMQDQTAERGSDRSSQVFSDKNYVINGSYAGALTLLTCCYAKQTDKQIYFNDISGAFSGLSMEYVFGYTIASHACGVIEIDGTFPEITVKDVKNQVEKACMEKIKTFLSKVPDESIDKYIANLNIIRDYFGFDNFKKEDLLAQ